MSTINSIIQELTSEEKELHKDIIEECVKREEDIKLSGEVISREMERLVYEFERFFKNVDKFYKISLELEKNCQETVEKMNASYLNSIDDELFFHA